MTSSGDFIGGLQRGEMAADNFTIIANTTARDPRLHLADRGLLVDMMSHKKGFIITEQSLANRCADGITVVRNCLERLRALGYIYRGKRTRYPKGTKNSAGKNIGGALGPYQWYVTDKPDVIATILLQVAREQAAFIAECEQETAGQDYRPKPEVVATSANAQPVDNPDLPQVSVGSSDLGEQGVSAAHDNLRFTTSGNLSTKEDQPEEEQEEEQRADAAVIGGEPNSLRSSGPETSTAAAVDGTSELRFEARPPDARADAKKWHGVGGMIGDDSPAARNARAAIVSGRRGPSRNQRQQARQRLDPVVREQVRAELAQRPPGLPRVAGLPLNGEQQP